MIACIDVGLKRIGIALGYKNGVIVPINAVLRQNRNQAAKDVKHILDEWNVKKLVVGIPLGGSSEDEMRRRISHFVNLLDFNGEIVFFDESFSSVEAGEFGVANHKKKDGKLDSLSAMVILQRYFDSLK
ncbi:Holliday junction resolvase-like protein (UPF0081 domain) [Campylobacter ureolyticus RIGS 9880]|uniref:Putative pre-16S rRNA nuclease n=1 Tax=Campylobacter ureolyticus RIGS 9880 TaxID=1032069 RepID=A0AAU8TZX1_9BACT|nr:Holliday junction resolvase RuvX [Campylobacter ureolyticus]AKT90683.1 Holliday junction resolvase-like protein (UPF0081 domain) [Campylobacter ureolyticus RIGS 9880]